jgi:hypothetical protein
MAKKVLNLPAKGPRAVGKDARKLLGWLETNYEIEPGLPLVERMLRITNRLQEIDAAIKKSGGVEIDGKPNVLLAEERRYEEQWLKLWRAAGLSDRPEAERRSVGRPPESERWPWPA